MDLLCTCRRNTSSNSPPMYLSYAAEKKEIKKSSQNEAWDHDEKTAVGKEREHFSEPQYKKQLELTKASGELCVAWNTG